jgi:hypothetical protein
MTSGQTGTIRVFFEGIVDRIRISADADVIQEAVLPSIVIQTVNVITERDERVREIEEPLRSLGVVRYREHPTRRRVLVNVECHGQNDLFARLIADAVGALFEGDELVRSLARDEVMAITEQGPGFELEDEEEQQYRKVVVFTANTLEWRSSFRDVPTATSVQPRFWVGVTSGFSFPE